MDAGGGYLLNNELGDFNAVPGLTDCSVTTGTPPNLVAPQKRPLSSMTPSAEILTLLMARVSLAL